ncbi:MAG TPA: hypothetical protein PKY87_08095 [Terricaulis sp.]|nr:hypothetical protein [Terricaulis sp.]
MTPRERVFDLAWPAFKRLAIRALGRPEAAELFEEAARMLRAEQAVIDQRHKAAEESNVIFLGSNQA